MEPTAKVRRETYARDLVQCVSCGSAWRLEYQHRRATGAGGTKYRPAFADGLTACSRCNMRYESDLQEAAIRRGWKVLHWVADPALVPVYYATERAWYRLDDDGGREWILPSEAKSMLAAVYGSGWIGWME